MHTESWDAWNKLKSKLGGKKPTLEAVLCALREAPESGLSAAEEAYRKTSEALAKVTKDLARAIDANEKAYGELERVRRDTSEAVQDQSVDALIAAFGGGGSGSAPKLKKQKSPVSDPQLKAWADLIRKAGEKKVAYWKDYPDPDMRKMAREDAADLKKIARMIETGNITKAKGAIRSLDTIVREEIPNEVWDGLGMSDY